MKQEEKQKQKQSEYFISPTKGKISFDNIIYDLVDYMEASPKDKYMLVVGSDSKLYREKAVFVSVIFIHRVGKGARYYYRRKKEKIGRDLRRRMYMETGLSLELGQILIKRIHRALSNANLDYDFEIHVDIGKKGPTKEMIREIIGMIQGNGFVARYKPESFCASTVADKHT
jgi:predicted RNase H-related nuclease YkuK (DUF458 family)